MERTQLINQVSNVPNISKETADKVAIYLSEKKSNTIKGYITTLNILGKASGKDLLEITRSDTESFRNEIEDKSNKTFNNYVGCLVSLFAYLDENYGTNLRRLVSSIPRREISYNLDPRSVPTKAETDKVLQGLLDENKLIEFVPLYMVLRCALSTDDVTSLRCNMIHLKDRRFYIHFRGTGQLRARDVIMPDDVTGTLNVYIEKYRKDWVQDKQGQFFLNNAGRPLSARTLQMMLNKACLAADVKPFTLNDMRNLGIPQMIAEGETWSNVAAMTGTGTEWYMNRYSDLIKRCGDEKDDKREEIKAFIPSYREGKMDEEKIAKYVGLLPWEVRSLIDEILDEDLT